MMNRIDVSGVLKTSVCDLYSNLVTRPTGAAVRIEIEHRLDEIGDRALAVLDFSHVGLLDFSCADEIVAKLLQQYVSVDIPRREVYFLFYGMNEGHMDAIESVLERHGLALVTQRADGTPYLMGKIDGDERRIWECICELGKAEPAEVMSAAGLERECVERGLDDLWRRRLVIRQDNRYMSLAGGKTESPRVATPTSTPTPES
ncbi:MAG TPA: hypothetical protein VNC11_01585 [Gemmatimonadaceae bacterium]|jgi:hypothetical protein|nr:hypothetical protein [Gemmatimonadaceae bacterium]